MQFDRPLALGTLLRRYKRFLADVRMDDGTEITAHCANTGSMKGCAAEGSRVALSHYPDSGRKLPWSWELVDVDGFWVGINTARPNRVVESAIASGRVGPLRGYASMRREVKYGSNSRIDLLLESDRKPPCYVEVKNVTLKAGRQAVFPDAVTERGARHLDELEKVVADGGRAVMFFLVNRGDCGSFAPAEDIDPHYAATLRRVAENGVELLAYRTRPDLEGIEIDKKIPLRL